MDRAPGDADSHVGGDAADAVEIGLTLEFTGKPDEARKWYERLVKQSPAAREALKARGSLKRLGSVGQPFELDSTTLSVTSWHGTDATT